MILNFPPQNVTYSRIRYVMTNHSFLSVESGWDRKQHSTLSAGGALRSTTQTYIAPAGFI